MLDASLLIGETIIFKPNTFEEKRGVVMGVGSMKFNELDIFPTTAFNVVTDEKGTVEQIPYHQVKGIIEPDITLLEMLCKEGDMVNIDFPKYYKPEHPKGWNVQGEVNTDLPFS